MSRRGDLETGRWKRIRLVVLQRDGYECQIQGPTCTQTANTVDHILPHALGGDDSFVNLRAACKSCNSVAGGRMRGRAGFSTAVPALPPPPVFSLAEGRVGTHTTRHTHLFLP